MKKSVAIAMCATVAMASSLLADTVTSVNVVGYFNLSVGGDPTADVLTMVSVPMTRLPVDRGVISTNSSQTITVAGAAWDEHVFQKAGDWDPSNGEEETYYVEVTSGSFEGRYFIIADNDATSLTLDAVAVDLGDGDLLGAGFKIIPAHRVKDVFGAALESTFRSSDEVLTADSVRLWNVEGQVWGSEIFISESRTGIRWEMAGVAIGDGPIPRDAGMMIRRHQGEPITVSVSGEVSGNTQAIVMPAGFSLQNGMVANDVALGDSGLESIMLSSDQSSTADVIYAWDQDLSVWVGPIFIEESRTGTDWNVGADYELKAGKAYLFFINDANVAAWERQSPLQ